MITLHRSAPPSTPGDTVGHDGAGYPVTVGDDGALWVDGKRMRDTVTLAAFGVAAAKVFGRHWHEDFGIVTGVSRADRWAAKDMLPPARLVKWIAWVAAQDNARALGPAMVSWALSEEVPPWGEVWSFITEAG